MTNQIKEINKNFLIVTKFKDSKSTKAIGAGQYSSLVGYALKNKHFRKVLKSEKQTITFKLRRGLEIKFISK